MTTIATINDGQHPAPVEVEACVGRMDAEDARSHFPSKPTITTIIFDVDDTLYDVGTGFTAHRNTEGATSFMVDKLYFPSKAEAQIVRDEYFKRYHSTAKGLTAAEAEGRLPPLPEGVTLPPGRTKMFDASELDEYWARNLDFALLGGPDPKCIEFFDYLSNNKSSSGNSISSNPNSNNEKSLLNIVAFSNGPRKYVCRVLKEIGLDSYFSPENIFAVTDVLPHCKPDKASFELVLERIGAKPHETIMVEDSMKNIRMAKSLGMRTILVTGRGTSRSKQQQKGDEEDNATTDETKVDKLLANDDAEATNIHANEDAPDESDPAVDASVEVVSEIINVLNLWLD